MKTVAENKYKTKYQSPVIQRQDRHIESAGAWRGMGGALLFYCLLEPCPIPSIYGLFAYVAHTPLYYILYLNKVIKFVLTSIIILKRSFNCKKN